MHTLLNESSQILDGNDVRRFLKNFSMALEQLKQSHGTFRQSILKAHQLTVGSIKCHRLSVLILATLT